MAAYDDFTLHRRTSAFGRFRAPTPRRIALPIASIEPLPPICLPYRDSRGAVLACAKVDDKSPTSVTIRLLNPLFAIDTAKPWRLMYFDRGGDTAKST